MTVGITGDNLSDMEFIQRYQATADESPPWAGISFKYPVDSDVLAERLKSAYPKCRTLRERKHQATIDFLVEELERMRTKDPTTPTILASVDLPFDGIRQDVTKGYIEISSDRSRPQSASGYTSSVSGSVHSPGMVDPARTNASAGVSSKPWTTPSAINSQQIVWNSHNGQSMRPKTKRKMTLEERKAYKKTRAQGACDSCRKQKARCTHVVKESAQPTKPNKRKDSSELDNVRPKLIKTEHSSHTLNVVSDQPPAVHMIRSNGIDPDGSSWYVNTESTRPIMELFDVNPPGDDGSWPPSIPMDGMNTGFSHDPSLGSEDFSSALGNSTTSGFSFPVGHSFYDAPPWTDAQDQPQPGST